MSGPEWVYIATDAEDRFVAVFADDQGQAACDFAEEDEEATYVARVKLGAEAERDAEAFWIAYFTVDEPVGTAHTARDDLYRSGTAKDPGRHGVRFANHPPIQNLEVVCCWAFTEAEAISRLRGVEIEGRCRAARDRAWREVEEEARAKQVKWDWDPYGLWIDRIPGLAERLQRAAEEAYNHESRRLGR